MAKFIAQIILAGSQILGRAFARAIRQEIEASQDAARRLGSTKTRAERLANTKTGISLDEAKQILNITSQSLESEEITRKYEALFKANERENGGTLYIQSKVVRAKERFDMEFKEPEPQEKQDNKSESERSGT